MVLNPQNMCTKDDATTSFNTFPCDEKKGANEALDKWIKHHQHLKVAKGQNFQQLMVL
jgi:hypothetical protein